MGRVRRFQGVGCSINWHMAIGGYTRLIGSRI
jgi:hypothetical protein